MPAGRSLVPWLSSRDPSAVLQVSGYDGETRSEIQAALGTYHGLIIALKGFISNSNGKYDFDFPEP
ncbi:hypothetical protein Bpla01_03830 [Burkholderia plantarii]|nr:hypothetical protein Bpla01_03830 [Burkholderia plantarii]